MTPCREEDYHDLTPSAKKATREHLVIMTRLEKTVSTSAASIFVVHGTAQATATLARCNAYDLDHVALFRV